MKERPLFKKIIYSSCFLAVIPAFLIMFFLPPLGSKYKLIVEDVDKQFLSNVYTDLNSDSVSEMVCLVKGVPYYNILVSNNNYQVYDQWNLMDNIDRDLSSEFFGNFDNDRFKEIYIFTYKDDSLFLNINEFFEPQGTRLERIFITKIGVINGKVTSNTYPAGFFDNNGDGKGEFYFSIQTGFGLEPRRIYYFDIVRKELKTSEFTGVICQKPSMVDIDGDSKPELFGVVGASGNYKIRPPYSDSSSWLMVFNENLKFEFPPVEFYGLTNQLETFGYKNGDFKGYLLSHQTGTADTTVLKAGIMLFSSAGKLIRDHLYSDYGFNSPTYLVVMNHNNKNRIYLFNKELLELNEELDIINKVKSPFRSNFTLSTADIDFDGNEEFLLYSENEEKLVIYNASLNEMSETKLKANMYSMKHSYYLSKDHNNKLFLTSTENCYFLKMAKNNYHYLGFLAYPGIYLLIVIFIDVLNRINTHKVRQKEGLQQRLITLQLQGIKAQLDPHFTFNTLNSIASLIYLEDRQAAYDYMTKFTELLRGMLNDAERIYRSMAEELAFLTTYLDLEKLRFGDKFNYQVEIGEGVSQKEQVPKLVLQTFAENAIKHGIMTRSEGGILKIKADRENDYLKLTIEDNGVGRAAASGQSASTGKGLRLTGEFYDILNQINKRPIKHLITDLYDENGEPSGTKVEVWVPVDE
jgi:two-component sensor histidine kinase